VGVAHTKGGSLKSSPFNDLTQLRDEDLLTLIASGDNGALGALYDRYARLVFSISLRITGDRLSAEEVTQDVFLVVWQHAASFRPSAGVVGGWLVGITRHRAIDEIRSRQHKARGREIPSDDAPLDTMVSREKLDDRVAVDQDIKAALAELPAAQRQAIELAYYGGMTCNEIASSVGTSSGTIKTRLRLGMVKLRGALLPGWSEDDNA
jgi:RNA polymerase sigma-70 factor, ECF subfamily